MKNVLIPLKMGYKGLKLEQKRVNGAFYHHNNSGIGYFFIEDFENYELKGTFNLKPWQCKNIVHKHII